MEKYKDQIPSIYTISLFGAEKILKKIQLFSQREKLLLKNDNFLENHRKHNVLIDRLEFFTPEHELEDTAKKLKDLFLSVGDEELTELSDDVQIVVCDEPEKESEKKGRDVNLFLEIQKKPYRIPFELRLLPYHRHNIYPRKKSRESIWDQEVFTYYTFPPEEYLAFAFYEILNGLEFINDLNWYKEVYEILLREPLEGRKVWESLEYLLTSYPIPSVEKRLITIADYKNYGYMKKRWKSQSRRCKDRYPQWEQVITLLVDFFTPIFEGVMKDEIFLGDWMPQLGRYLD